MTDKSVILDTPAQLEMFHLLQIKYALRIEVHTGMRHSRGSVLKVANAKFTREGWATCRTKKQALEQMDRLIDFKEGDL